MSEMCKELKVSYKAPYYNFEIFKNVNTTLHYDCFINWVSGEFELLQQDCTNGLKAYFSNGWFVINGTKNIDNSVEIIIKISSKSHLKCLNIKGEIDSVFRHVNRFIK